MGANFNSRASEVIAAARAECKRKLEMAGQVAEGYAVIYLDSFPRWDSGNLATHIAHAVDPDGTAVYVGTNVEYAIWVEVGTGIYAADGKGRKTPWVYMDDEGEFHVTSGMEAAHFLKNAVEKHTDEYREILKNG